MNAVNGAGQTYKSKNILWGEMLIRAVCHARMLSVRLRETNVLGAGTLGTTALFMLHRLPFLHFLERGSGHIRVVQEELLDVAKNENEAGCGDKKMIMPCGMRMNSRNRTAETIERRLNINTILAAGLVNTAVAQFIAGHRHSAFAGCMRSSLRSDVESHLMISPNQGAGIGDVDSRVVGRGLTVYHVWWYPWHFVVDCR